nr:MAG TPA: hypothetical protein [Bacteriophage sp.]
MPSIMLILYFYSYKFRLYLPLYLEVLFCKMLS